MTGRPARARRGPHDPIGLVVVRPAADLVREPFLTQFIAGVEEVLGGERALRLCLAADTAHEVAVHRAWWLRREVAGAIVVDVRMADERLPVLRELGMPVVLAGPPSLAGGLPAQWSDDEAAADAVVRYLAALGHRRIARVAGDPLLAHTVLRDRAFADVATALGLDHVSVPAHPAATPGAAARGDAGHATRRLLLGPAPPTAIVYDSTPAAVAALTVAAEMGVDVPGALSVIAWDDSPLCRVTRPRLSVVRHDVHGYGARTARALLCLVAGTPPPARQPAVPVLRPRASTAVRRTARSRL